MSFIEALKAARSNPQVEWNSFLTSFKPTSRSLYVFLEGRVDVPFYSFHIRKYFKEGWTVSFVRCGPKRNVLRYWSDFSERFGVNHRAIFFVDRDFDHLFKGQLQKNALLYETSCYSVENFVCSIDAVERYCIEAFGVAMGSAELAAISDAYINALQSFDNVMLSIMAWMLAARRQGLNPNLGNLSTADLVELDSDFLVNSKLPRNGVIGYLRSRTGHNAPLEEVCQCQFVLAIRDLSALTFDVRTRGKQAAWLVVAFLRRIQTELSATDADILTRIQISEANAVEVLAPRIDTPQCLDRFMSRIATALSMA